MPTRRRRGGANDAARRVDAGRATADAGTDMRPDDRNEELERERATTPPREESREPASRDTHRQRRRTM